MSDAEYEDLAFVPSKTRDENAIRELAALIRETAYQLHVYLGTGYLEKVYENALKHRLEKAGLKVRQQVPIRVYDEDGFQVVFYFMLIRPQRKKDKQVKEMLNNLKAGDRVCTIGGIYGTIVGIRDDTVTLSVGRDNTNMVIARWGIRSVEEITIENDAQDLN